MACFAPTITPASLDSVDYGVSYSQQLTSSISDYYIWSASGLPNGASIDQETGILSWDNVVPGEYTFIVRVDDDIDPVICFGTKTYTIEVTGGNYSSSKATQADHYNRLQHFMCCLGEKGAKLSTKLRTSSDCCCDINTFETLVMYWSVLVCYDPTLTGNCLTQDQIDAIWDDIASKCGICFAPYGSSYRYASTGCGNRVVTSGEYRITTSGNIREISCGDATGNSTSNSVSLNDNTTIYYS